LARKEGRVRIRSDTGTIYILRKKGPFAPQSWSCSPKGFGNQGKRRHPVSSGHQGRRC
jgi:hypothetical protein